MIKEYGYEYNSTLDEQLWERTHMRSADDKLGGAVCLRSGRDALKVIARENRGNNVLLPSLCCDSMIVPFEMYDCKTSFYGLKTDLSADEVDVCNQIEKFGGNAVLLVSDYFGREMFAEHFLEKLKDLYPKLVLVKDITHTFLNECKKDLCDYTVASIRKWARIPDGGLLWINNSSCANDLSEDLSFFEKRLKAQCLRTDFFENGNNDTKVLYRKMFIELSEMLDSGKEPVKMSAYAYEQIQNIDWLQIKHTRKTNAKALIDIFSKEKKIKLIQPEIQKSNLYVPFVTENRDSVQRKLAEKGIFTTVIWPLREEQTQKCSVTRKIGESMLAAPCDQRYTQEDMRYIGEQIVRTVNE